MSREGGGGGAGGRVRKARAVGKGQGRGRGRGWRGRRIVAVGRGGVVVDVIEIGVDIGAAVEAPDHLGGAPPRGEADRHPGEAGEPRGGPGGKVEEAGGNAATAAARDLGELAYAKA